VSVSSKVHDSPESTRYARLRRAFGEGNRREHWLAPIVALAYFALAYFDGGTDPQFRAGAAIALWLVVILGLVLGLWPRAPVPRPALVAGLCLGGLAALAALSMTWASNNEDAFIAVIRVLTFLGLFVAVVLASSSDGSRPWLLGLGIALAGVAVLAILGRTQPGLFSAAEEIRAELQPARERLSFPTAYWNGLGACMAIGIVLFGWLAADAGTRLARAAATAVIPVAALALFLTASRGSIVALGIGVVVLLVFGRSRPVLAGSLALGGGAGIALILAALAFAPAVVDGELETAAGRSEGDVLLLVTVLAVGAVALVRYVGDPLLSAVRAPNWAARAAVAVALVAVAVAVVLSNPVERIEAFAEAPQGGGGTVTSHLGLASGSGRYQYWEVGLEAFASAPLGGIGAGGFEGYWAEHHTFPAPVSFSHSVFVTELAELGIGGLALIVGFFLVAFVAGLRARAGPGSVSARAATLAVLAAGTFAATIDWMWEFPAVFTLVVVAAALLTGPAFSAVRERQRSRFGFAVAALATGWVTIVVALLSFFGQAKIGASEEALERGDLEESISQANTAETLQPWAAEPYLLEAAALEAQGSLEGARAAVEGALERAPNDARVWAVAARIEMTAGRVERGLETLARANELSPSVAPLSRGQR
jgi:cytochrome c-type biogenesis protein CcmH/NrfG